jgi:hypothetical protein
MFYVFFVLLFGVKYVLLSCNRFCFLFFIDNIPMNAEAFMNMDSSKQSVSVSSNDNSVLAIMKNSLVSPSDKVYFEEVSGKTSTGNMVTAVVILVLGVSTVIGFFVFLMAGTRFVNKRLSKIRNGRDSKNVDVEGDYLINGMYL